MSRVKTRDTKPEMMLRSALHRVGLRYRVQVRDLPGRPDIVFPARRVVVFVDGDFWHGFRFAQWRTSVSPFWLEKINKNRLRDYLNRRKLQRSGWKVIRVWEHEVEEDIEGVVSRVSSALGTADGTTPPGCRARPDESGLARNDGGGAQHDGSIVRQAHHERMN